MNWGYKITLVIIVFIITMLSMVFVAFKQSNEMVDSNYYEKELKYQSLIDAAHNLNTVSKADLLTQNDSGILVTIPLNLIADFKNGKLNFLKNDNEKGDFTLIFKPDAKGKFLIDKKILHGSYKVRIEWMSKEMSYYREQNLILK